MNLRAAFPYHLVLKNRPFRWLLVGDGLSSLGNGVSFAAVTTHVAITSGNTRVLGLLALCQFLPQVLFALSAGHVADRISRRVIVIAADLLRAVLAIALGLIVVSQPSNYLVMGVLLTASAICTTYFAPAFTSLSRSVLRDDEVREGIALVAAVRPLLSRFLGPIIGAALVGLTVVPYFVNAATFLLAAAAVVLALGRAIAKVTVGRPAPAKPVRRAGSAFPSRLRWVLAADAVTTLFFWGAYQVVAPVRLASLETSPQAISLFIACGGFGAILGSYFGAPFAKTTRPGTRAVVMWLIGLVVVVVWGFAGSVYVFAATVLIANAAFSLGNIAFQSALQLEIVPEQLGRALGTLYFYTNLATGASVLAFGFIVSNVTSPSLIISGLVGLVVVGLVSVSGALREGSVSRTSAIEEAAE